MRYLILICAALLLVVRPAAAQDSPWEIRMLPADPTWIYNWANDINEAGHVCGSYAFETRSWHAVLWKDGTWIDVGSTYGLPDGYPYSGTAALTDTGLIGGAAVSARIGALGYHQIAILWDTMQGSFETFHEESVGISSSRISALNSSGLAVLDYIDLSNDGTAQLAYLLDLDTGAQEPLPIPPGLGSSAAIDINEAGQISGWVQDDSWAWVSHAAVWLENGTVVRDLHEDIRALAPAVDWSRAFEINQEGKVVGLGWNEAFTESWAWTWTEEEGVVLLDRGPSGIALSTGIFGRIVIGNTGDYSDSRGAVWIDGVLHELLPIPDYPMVFGVTANSSGVILFEARSDDYPNGSFIAEPRDEGDFDGDALRDKWELQGYTHDNGTHVDLFGMGANPLRRDLFVEIDAMVGGGYDHRPNPETLQPVVDAFAAHEIALHIHIDDDLPFDANLGTLDGLGRYQWDEFDALKTAHFDEELESAVRYCVFAHRLATLTDSGLARGEPSSDFIVSLGAFVEESGSTDPWMQAGTFMHELGHTLGLRHGGADVTNRKPNYLSVMNYDFQKQGLRIAGQDGNFDYSVVQLAELNENALVESAGLGVEPLVAGHQTLYRVVTLDPITFETTVEAVWSGEVQGAIDWDGSGAIDGGTVSADINADGAKGALTSHHDWAALDFNGGTVGFGVGLPPPPPPPETEVVEELTVEEAKLIPPPPVEGLAGRAGRRSVRISWTPVGPYGQGTYKVYRWSDTQPRVLVAETQASLISDRPGRGTWTYVVTVTDSVGAESLDSGLLTLLVR